MIWNIVAFAFGYVVGSRMKEQAASAKETLACLPGPVIKQIGDIIKDVGQSLRASGKDEAYAKRAMISLLEGILYEGVSLQKAQTMAQDLRQQAVEYQRRVASGSPTNGANIQAPPKTASRFDQMTAQESRPGSPIPTPRLFLQQT